jgi:hypothetical protein
MGGAFATGRGLRFTSQRPKCFKIFFITPGSSMNEIIRICTETLRAYEGIDFVDFLYQSRPISPGSLAGQFRFKEAGDFIVGVCLFSFSPRNIRRNL